jgi:long-chain acyl-CoA synthetase
VVDQSRSRFPVAYARLPGDERPKHAQGLTEPAARSLEYWAAVRADRPALFEGTASLTYRDWNEYADMLADGFVSRGLGLDDVIAVRCRNRIEWAVIAMACAKIEARLLPLDPDMPPSLMRERLIASRASAFIIGDTSPARISAALDGLDLRLRTSMDGAAPGFFNFWDLFPPVSQPRFGRIQPSILAWTAGEKARAVGLPRRRNAPAAISKPPVPDDGVSLITVPLHRTWGSTQFWSALTAGRSIAVMRCFNAAEALEAIAKRGVTHWGAFPESFAELHRLGLNAIRAADTTTLKELVVGGSPVPLMLKAWLATTFGPIVSEAYGSTETGVIATLPASNFGAKRGSSGRPIRGALVEIRDASGRRLPAGVEGQVWARTPRTLECEIGGFQGRHRDDDGYVATGDAGRFDTDGFLYLTGRADASGDLRRLG